MSEPIESFIQPILDYFDKLNNNLYTKSRKVTARDVFYHNMVATLNGDGIIDANIIFAIQSDNMACPTAIRNATEKLPPSAIRNLNDHLVSRFFKNKGGRTLAVDGSAISLTKYMTTNHQFQKTNTGSYNKAFLTVIYDVEARIPIALRIDLNSDERASLIALSRYIKPGDKVNVDRNYYSKDLYNYFDSRGVNLICRLSESNKMVMNVKKDDSEDVEKNTQNILDLEGGDDIIYTYQGVHARRVRFRLPVNKTDTVPDALEKEYTFVTNLDPILYPIQTIKALYHQRWDIEEFYKVLKTRLGGDFYNYKTVEAMYRKLYFQALVAIITGFVMKKNEEEWLANPPINPPKNKKWKQKPSINYTLTAMTSLLSALIYSKPVEEINRILNIITKKAKTIIRPNRSNPRKTIRPPSVFYKAKKTNEIEATDPNKPTKWCKRPKNMVKKKEPVTSIKLKPKKDCNKSPKKSTNLAPLKAHKKLSKKSEIIINAHFQNRPKQPTKFPRTSVDLVEMNFPKILISLIAGKLPINFTSECNPMKILRIIRSFI